jgi:mannosyltransferase
VVSDGDTGLLVPVDDAAALAAAIETLMRDPARAEAIGKRGRAHVAAHFSIEAEAEKIAAVYRRVLAAST